MDEGVLRRGVRNLSRNLTSCACRAKREQTGFRAQFPVPIVETLTKFVDIHSFFFPAIVFFQGPHAFRDLTLREFIGFARVVRASFLFVLTSLLNFQSERLLSEKRVYVIFNLNNF